MRRTERMYETCVGSVLLITGVSLDEYERSKSECATDARMLAIGWMSGYGVSEAELCRLTAWKQQRVNYLKNTAAIRLNRRMFREMYNELTEMMRMVEK